MSMITEIIGWGGVLLYVAAYLLLSLRKLSAGRFTYHLLNILGALGLIINALNMDDYPSLVVNIAWLAIACLAILFIAKEKRNHVDSAA